MPDWRRVRVDQLESDGILLVQDGNHGEYRPRREEFTDDGCAFIRAADMLSGRPAFKSASKINGTARARIRKGIGAPEDVLLSHKGTVGRVAFAPEGSPPFVCSPQTTFYRSLNHETLRPLWLFYYLQSPAFVAQLASRKGETDMADYVSLTEQRRLHIEVPPPLEQDRIIAVLNALDKKVSCNGDIVSTSRALAISTLRYAANKSETLVGEVADVLRGLSYSGAGLAAAGVPMVNLANAANFGWLKRDGFKYYTGEYKPRHVATPGSLLVSGVDLTWRLEILGYPMLVPEDVGPVLFSHHIQHVKFKPQFEWMRLPLWAHLYSTDARARMEGMAYGTTVATLPQEAITGLTFPTPDQGSTSIELADRLLRRAWAAETESGRLTALRDTLLPGLVSGDIRALDVGTAVAEAV